MGRAGAGAVLIALIVACSAASEQSPLASAQAALGPVDISTIEYTGSGANFPLGQAPNANTPWPRFIVKKFTALVDYGAPAMRVEMTRTNGEARGGGGTIVGEQTQAQFVRGNHAWTAFGSTPAPAPAAAAERLLQIWLTPHGFLRAAKVYGARAQTRTDTGRSVTTVTVAPPGRAPIVATLDAEHLIARVESQIDNAVLGDMPIEAVYLDYRDFGGTKFPTRIVQRQGGHPTLDITVTGVTLNPPASLDVPPAIVNARPAVAVVAQPVADGVWYLTGGTHHSVAVAFADHMVVIEAPQSEERSVAVMAKVKELAPDKPIRYLVNTHQHFDHSGGVRAYAAEGIAIVTHALYKPYYEAVFANPHTLAPDRLSRSGRQPVIEAVTDKHVLSDATRTIELHHIQGNLHNDGLLMAYLPKERLLVQADGFSPGPPESPPPPAPNPFTVNLYENIERLRLDVAQILALHGRIVTMDDLRAAIGVASR